MLRRISKFIGNNCATIKTGFMEGYHKGLHREALASQERSSDKKEEEQVLTYEEEYELHDRGRNAHLNDDSPGLCDA